MSTLQKIVRKAKKLYKSGRAGIKWKSAIKKAAASLKKHAGGSRPARKKSARKPARRRSQVTRRKAVTRKARPVSTRFKNDVKSKLAKALLDYDLADTVKATKEAQKRKIKYRKILRSL